MDQRVVVDPQHAKGQLPAESVSEIERRVAERIRGLRRQRGMTLQKLAERANVSKSMISKVERGEASPSATTMSRLADGLGVSISNLLGERDRHDMVVQRAADQPVHKDRESGWTRRTLSPAIPSNGLDIILCTVPTGGTYGPIDGHRYGVDEHVVITKGQVGATIGNVEHILKPGDALYYQAHVSHRFHNVGDEEAEFLVVIENNSHSAG